MTPEEIRGVVRLPQVIEGIFNYCDRWCERCGFRQRCSVFLTNEADGLEEHVENPEAEPPTMEASLESVANSFEVAMEMLKEDMEEEGVDWAEVEAMAKALPPRRRKREPGFVKEAKAYISQGSAWLEGEREGIAAAVVDLVGEEAEQAAKEIADAMEVLGWYQHQIYVKLKRALGQEEDEEDGLDEYVQRDRDGSAKVALIGLDRSIRAWERLGKWLPEKRGETEAFVRKLKGVRRGAERRFPGARGFVRPGFDDPRFAELVRQFSGEG